MKADGLEHGCARMGSGVRVLRADDGTRTHDLLHGKQTGYLYRLAMDIAPSGATRREGSEERALATLQERDALILCVPSEVH